MGRKSRMRWFAHAAVTVALLACGLFVYDVLREDKSEERAWDLGAGARDTGSGQGPERGSERAALPGAPGTPGISPAAADLLERLARLEEAARDLPRFAGGGSGGGATPAGAPGAGDPGPDGSTAPAVVVDPGRLKSFRLAMEAVERVQREEQLSRSIRGQMTSLNLSLPPTQEQGVVDATTRLWRAQAELWRSLGTQAADESRRQQAQADLETLREAWATEIRRDLSASDAEKVIQHFGRGVGGVGPGTRFGPDFVRPPGGPPGVPR
jgi:hypothetical protein